MRPETNGVGVLDMTDYGPYKIWDADKYKCPKCGYEIVTAFGQQALAEHWQKENFDTFVEAYRKQGVLIECRSK